MLVHTRSTFDKGFRKVFFVVPNGANTVYNDFVSKYGADQVFLATSTTAEVAIQSAINQCVSNANDAVYLLPGTFTTAAAISLNKNITLLGTTDNAYGTIIAPATAIVAIVATAAADYAVMKNFTITIGASATEAVTVPASCSGVRMENVVINGAAYATGQIGVTSSSDYFVMKGCRITGIKTGATSYGSHCLFADNYLQSTQAASRGFTFTSGNYCVADNNDFVYTSVASIPIVLGSSGAMLMPTIRNNRSSVQTTVILATSATDPRYFNNNMSSSATVVLAAVVV